MCVVRGGSPSAISKLSTTDVFTLGQVKSDFCLILVFFGTGIHDLVM